MKPLSATEIHGNWATVVLPVNEDESIDFAALAEELDVILAANVNGVYTNGTAGEFLTQTETEFARISELVAEKCEEKNTPFQIGASHASPQTMLARTAFAAALKPSAIQVILPDWYPVTDEEAIIFLNKIAEAADPVKIILYNPAHAKRVLTPIEFAGLKQAVPNLVGIKVKHNNDEWYAAMREHLTDLSVFVSGHFLATGFAAGAAGAYSNVACLHPAGAQKWYEMMRKDLPAAIELESRIQRFFRQYVSPLHLEQKYSPAALDKMCAAIGGWANISSRLRFPYRFVPSSVVENLKPVARRMMPELFIN